MLAPLSVAAPLAPASSDAPPASAVRASGLALELAEEGALVSVAALARVDVARILCAVAAVVAAACARSGLTDYEARDRWRTVEAAERVVGEDSDERERDLVEEGALRSSHWTDPAGEATRELCRAVVDERWAATRGRLAVDAEGCLGTALHVAAVVIGAEDALSRFCGVIPWAELSDVAAAEYPS